MAIIDNRDKAKVYKTVRDFSRDRYWLNKLNKDELLKLQYILEITSQELRLNEGNALKISKGSFTNINSTNLTDTQVISFLNILSKQIGLFMVANDEYAKYAYEGNQVPFINKAIETEGIEIQPQKFNFTKLDVKENILLVVFYKDKLVWELRKTDKQIRSKISKVESQKDMITKFKNTDINQLIKEIIHTRKLGKKEAKLLSLLADLEPYETKLLITSVPTKNYRRLKSTLNKKLRGTPLKVTTIKGSWGKHGFYQLEYVTTK